MDLEAVAATVAFVVISAPFIYVAWHMDRTIQKAIDQHERVRRKQAAEFERYRREREGR